MIKRNDLMLLPGEDVRRSGKFEMKGRDRVMLCGISDANACLTNEQLKICQNAIQYCKTRHFDCYSSHSTTSICNVRGWCTEHSLTHVTKSTAFPSVIVPSSPSLSFQNKFMLVAKSFDLLDHGRQLVQIQACHVWRR